MLNHQDRADANSVIKRGSAGQSIINKKTENLIVPTTDLSVSRSVGRGFQILDHFKRVRTPQTTQQIVAHLDAPYASVRAVLKMLREMEYLEYEEATRTYFPSRQLQDLGSWIQGARTESNHIRNLMSVITAEVRESVVLTTQNDLISNHLIVSNAKHKLACKSRTGMGLPMVSSIGGRAMLSQLPDSEIEEIIDKTRYWSKVACVSMRLSHAEIMESVRAVRTNGFLYGFDITIDGIGVVAYPIRTSLASTPSALFVAGASQRIRFKKESICRAIEYLCKSYKSH